MGGACSSRLFRLKRLPHGSSKAPTPTEFCSYRSFHRNREVNKFIVGEGFPLPPFVSIKPFVHGQRTPVPTVFGGYRSFHHNREIINSRYGRPSVVLLFRLNRSPQGSSKAPTPTGYGGNHLFHRSGEDYPNHL